MGASHSSPSNDAINEILGGLTPSQRGKVKKELKSYDIALVANNTKSMEKICTDDDVRKTLVNLTKIADALDCDVFDLHLVNGSQKYNLRGKDKDAIAEVLKSMPFEDGKSSLSYELRKLIDAYKDTPRTRKMNYIILLSEYPEYKGELKHLIKETVTWMQEKKLSQRQIGFQFVQIGNHRRTRGILHDLGAELRQEDIKTWDIVDRIALRTPNATVIVKILLGGILRRMDDMGPNWFSSIWREDIVMACSTLRTLYPPKLDPSKLVQKQKQLLVDYDTVVLVDDSATMSGADWRMALEALHMLINFAGERDTDGIDVYFVNDTRRFEGLKNELYQEYHENIDSILPHGNAPLKARLERIVCKYLDEISNQSSKGEALGKPVNYIVITNGQGLKDQGIEEFLVKVAALLDSKKFAHKKALGIQFLQIGNDEEVTNFFNDLDDYDEAKLDIVDTTLYEDVNPMNDTIAKALLGGISQKFDDKPRKSHTFQSNTS
ncbi:hypothetical protein BDN72DRAFT_793051 [Pluteus cervinus]|uniref:Uncharacterized protein n=1 Tax=Pluteus cervinus TaxID=181527 RepID=A0ACD3B220_9AGAR|nr:hypothetical protein BDN72DRAFT_793051 [Pluteus cervinus]